MLISRGVLYLLFALLFGAQLFAFIEFGVPSLEGRLGVNLFADTLTYEAVARGDLAVQEMVSISSNLWGPVVIAQMLGLNRPIIFAFNVALAAISVFILTHDTVGRRLRLFLLLCTSTLFMFSFFGVNKEVILFAISVCLYRFAMAGSLPMLFIAITLSFFVRWHMVLFCLIFWVAVASPLIRNRPAISGLSSSFRVGGLWNPRQYVVCSFR